MSQFNSQEAESGKHNASSPLESPLSKLRKNKRQSGLVVGAAVGILGAVASLGAEVTIPDLLVGAAVSGIIGWGIGAIFAQSKNPSSDIDFDSFRKSSEIRPKQILPIAGAFFAVLLFLYLFIPRDGLGGSSIATFSAKNLGSSDSAPVNQVGQRCEDQSGNPVGVIATLTGGSEGKQMCEDDGYVWRSYFKTPYSSTSDYSISDVVGSDLESYSLILFLLIGSLGIGGFAYVSLSKRQK